LSQRRLDTNSERRLTDHARPGLRQRSAVRWGARTVRPALRFAASYGTL